MGTLTSMSCSVTGVRKGMIFIVDDNPMDIELTTIALEATGREISVRYATDGKSALSMLMNGLGVPELILLDLKDAGDERHRRAP